MTKHCAYILYWYIHCKLRFALNMTKHCAYILYWPFVGRILAAYTNYPHWGLQTLVPGKMFTLEELEFISSVCKKHNVIVISDEVYERVVFGDNKHERIASLPGMD